MFGLSFLSPLFLIGAAAAAVPIILHLLRKEDAPSIDFSAVSFIEHDPIERSRRRHLRDLLLLALRVMALVIFAIAFARPYLDAADSDRIAPVTVVALDQSFSMGPAGHFEQAQALAREAIENVPNGTLVSLVAFDDRARVVVPASRDRTAALAAISQLTPEFGATRFRAALAVAAAEIGARPGEIKVITDLQQTGWSTGEGGIPDSIQVNVIDVGEPAPNLAVVALRRVNDALRAVIANSEPRARSVEVTLTVDDRRIGNRTVNVQPERSAEMSFPGPLPSQGVAKVSVEDPDGFPADDARYLVLDAPDPLNVLLLTNDIGQDRSSFFLERALRAANPNQPVTAKSLGGTEVLSLGADALTNQHVVIVLGTRAVDRRTRDVLAEYVKSGGGLWLTAGSGVDWTILGEILGLPAGFQVQPVEDPSAFPTQIAPVDTRHPIFSAFGRFAGNLGQVRFERAVRVEPGATGQVLARFTNGLAALVEYRNDRGVVLVFASDFNHEWNDFPLKATFLPFVHEAVRYLGRQRIPPREYLVGDAPPGVDRRPGPATVARRTGKVVLNVDPGESNVERQTSEAFATSIQRVAAPVEAASDVEARRREDSQSLWRYGLVVMGLILVGEGLVGRRAG